MVGVFNCSFAWVAARNSMYNANGKVVWNKNTHQQKFLMVFSENKEAFDISQHTFNKRSPVLLNNFNKWRGESKTKYLEHFSSTAWASLSEAKKGLHTISNCRACQTNDLLFHSLIPLRSNRLKGSDPVTACTKEAIKFKKINKG